MLVAGCDLLELLGNQIHLVRKFAYARVECSNCAFVRFHRGQKDIAGLHEDFMRALFFLNWAEQPFLDVFLG